MGKKSAKQPKSEAAEKPAKKKPEEPERWKWWEQDEKLEKGHNWNFMEHKGPIFAAPYVRLPAGTNMKYNGEIMTLSEETEEVMTFYAKMIEHEYTTKELFNKNFRRLAVGHDPRRKAPNC